MTDAPRPAPDRYAGLRAHAAAQRQATVDRLRAAIAGLEAAGRPVSTATIKQACALDYMAYRRNPEAYALYRRHSTHLRAKREHGRRGQGRPADPATETPPPARDRLLDYPKARLATALHAARAERDAWERRYGDLLQEHQACGVTIARLEAQLAELRASRERAWGAARDQGQGGQP